MIASIIAENVFGHTIKSRDDQFLNLGKETTRAIALFGGFPAMLVDFFPMCELQGISCNALLPNTAAVQHVPSWLPGGGWKRNAVKVHDMVQDMLNVPLRTVKAQMVCPPLVGKSILH